MCQGIKGGPMGDKDHEPGLRVSFCSSRAKLIDQPSH